MRGTGALNCSGKELGSSELDTFAILACGLDFFFGLVEFFEEVGGNVQAESYMQGVDAAG